MRKVLIADDNNIIRTALAKTIDWAGLGCEVAAEASNGLSALEAVEKCRPDLVVTDIKMPKMDGLELTERLKREFPWIKVIIITGYDNFKYAQRALKLGAFDLILKPVEKDELYSAVNRAVEAINLAMEERAQKQSIAEEKNQMQALMNETLMELRRKFLIDSILGGYLEEGLPEERMKYLRLDFQHHVCLFIKPELNGSIKNEREEGRPSEFLRAAQTALQKLVEPIKDLECIGFGLDYSFTVIAVPVKEDSESKINIRMMELGSQLCETLKTVTDLKFTMGISTPYGGVKEARKAHKEAQFALDCKFFIENKTIIHAASLQSRSIVNEYPVMKKINLIYEYIRTGQEPIDGLLDELFTEIRENETKDAAYVKSLFIDMCTIVRRILLENKGNLPEPFERPVDLHRDISGLSSISEVLDYVRAFILRVYRLVNSGQKKSYSTVVKRVIDYLNENYNKKILLQEIADLVALSPTHLSKLIRKETGESFIDLFNKIKINVAVKLLKETNMKLYEVANEVGIENYAYFYQLFKKVTGISPKEFSK